MRFSALSNTNRIALPLLCVIAILSTSGCERSGTSSQSAIVTGPADHSAEVVSDTPKPAPLLLLDDGESEDPTGPVADNSRCFVCHINYMTEPIAANHARQNIGCAGCHGASDAHIADESWASGGNGTAPDLMYPKGKINSACMACHPRDKIDAPHHEPAFAQADPKVCTDCHGDHRLPHRQCTWR